MNVMTIGQLADAAQVNVETVRYYHRRGLLPAPERPAGSIRRYSQASLGRLQFIKRARALGFALDDVAALLSLQDSQATCDDARAIGERHLQEIRERMRDLKALETVLASVIGKCRGRRGRVACPLIAALSVPAPA
jgi:MerR family transcriptional regulator, mercuric resistance operon regulatory protein